MVELIMVIVIMGVIGGAVAVFMKSPIDAYLASGRRAALTDVADTTVRRIARDLRRALPNSVRTSGTSCLEFIPTKTGGRYRSEGVGALDFGASTTSFNMLGDNTTFAGAALPASQTIIAGDLVVVYNLGPGVAGANAYTGSNSSAVTSVGAVSANETPININAKLFPLASGSNRFQVVSGAEQMVSYVCNGTSLVRRVDVLTAATCNTATGTLSVIANNVNCAATSFTYAGSDLQRNALVTMVLSIQDGQPAATMETVSLQHEVHVDNTP